FARVGLLAHQVHLLAGRYHGSWLPVTVGRTTLRDGAPGRHVMHAVGMLVPRRALVIEPDADVQIILTRILGRAFAEICTVEDGRAAEWQCKQFPPDIAVVGGYRSGLDQLDICKTIKAAGAAKVIALIAPEVNGRSMREDSVAADAI